MQCFYHCKGITPLIPYPLNSRLQTLTFQYNWAASCYISLVMQREPKNRGIFNLDCLRLKWGLGSPTSVHLSYLTSKLAGQLQPNLTKGLETKNNIGSANSTKIQQSTEEMPTQCSYWRQRSFDWSITYHLTNEYHTLWEESSTLPPHCAVFIYKSIYRSWTICSRLCLNQGRNRLSHEIPSSVNNSVRAVCMVSKKPKYQMIIRDACRETQGEKIELYLEDKAYLLAGWSQLESCVQQIYVQVKASDKRYPPGVCLGISTLQHFY